MVGINHFLVELDNPSGVYYTGMNVTGRVLLSLAKPKTVRALFLKIEGETNVRWTERRNHNKKRRTTVYTAHEEYFKVKLRLLGNGGGKIVIPIGNHVYPFSSYLSPTLPSSFHGEHGSVRYLIQAIMDRPLKIDHEANLEFKVIALSDLNQNPETKVPIYIRNEKTFLSLLHQYGPLRMNVSLPCKGFLVGEGIPLTIEVENASNVEVNEILCKLKRETRFIAHYPYHKEKLCKTDHSKLSLEGVGVNGLKSWTEQLPIPAMAYQNLEGCSIIKTSYIVKVSAKVGGLHKNMNIRIPIIIGNVPLVQSAGTNQFGQAMPSDSVYNPETDPPPYSEVSPYPSTYRSGSYSVGSLPPGVSPQLCAPYPQNGQGNSSSYLPTYENTYGTNSEVPSAPPAESDFKKTEKGGC